MKPIRFDIRLFIIVVFMGVSVWLSLEVSRARQLKMDLQAELISAGQQNAMLQYRLSNLQEILKINIAFIPMPILFELPETINQEKGFPLLYLRANACSPCIMPAIEYLTPYIKNNKDFRIVAHPTNRAFLEPLFGKASCPENEDLILYSEKLYEYENNPFDAKLLLIDGQRRITALLPLEMLREEDLFAELKEKKFFGLH